MGEIMAGEATPAQIGGFLVALRAKGETADEIAGCAEAMRAHVLPVPAVARRRRRRRGNRRRRRGTFNISTTAAIVAAAAGAAVAKHGNRAVSSISGSADVLEALGFALEQPAERIAESIDTLGFGFMFAPLHHPAMRHAAPVRRELGTRTVFNVLGPLTNPAGARAGVFGVYSAEMARTVADALAVLDSRRAFVVHGANGIDELSPAGPNLVLRGRRRRGPRAACSTRSSSGSRACDPAELAGGSPDGERRDRARDPLGRRRCETRRGGAERRGRDRRGRACGRPARGDRRRRGRHRQRSRARLGWMSSSRSRENPRDGTLRRRTARSGTDRDRGGEATLALGRRPAPGRRSGSAGRRHTSAQARPPSRSSSTSASAAPGTTCAQRARARRCRSSRRASSRPRPTCEPRARRAQTRRSCSCATSTTPTARRLSGVRGGARARDARRGARRRRARASRRSRRAGHRDQRARSLDLRDRPRRAAAARRAGAARPRRRRRERDRVARAGSRRGARRCGRDPRRLDAHARTRIRARSSPSFSRARS